MNNITLDFVMAKENRADSLLRSIAQEALTFFLENTDEREISCILLTGSLANAEGTVIEYKSRIIASDFDFVIYSKFHYFLRNRGLFQKLSKQMTATLLKKGINSHVEFLPCSRGFRSVFSFLNSNIYEYEFAFASKRVFGRPPIFNKNIRPSRKDALELVFTVASDLVFSDYKQCSELEMNYVYAKRALTLLNSLLIFKGVFAKTYKGRLQAAKEQFTRGTIPLSQNEMRMLELFTEYKLSGSLRSLMASLNCNKLTNLVRTEREFLKELTMKIIFYELSLLTAELGCQNSAFCNFREKISLDLIPLLNTYLSKTEMSLSSRLAGIVIYMIAYIRKDRERSDLFTACVFGRQSPKTTLNYAITVMLLYGQTPSRQMLGKAFPWICLKGPANKKMFCLWRLAEQSIKLN